MIKVENLTKNFNDFKALDNISFEIKPGEIVGLLGPNGAGKTTTLRMLTSYFNPTFGTIRYDNLDIIEDTVAIQKKIGYLPESNPLYQELKVKEFLNYAAQMHDIPKNEVKAAIDKVAKKCGLTDKLNQQISELSKGYKQRVGLAQALIHDPEILILDEPTEGLDPNQRIDIRGLIKEIGKEKTIIISSHVLSEVEATCGRVLIISQGKIVASGSPAELKSQITSQTIIFLTIDGPKENIVEALKKMEGVERIIDAKTEDKLTKIELETDSTLDLRNKLVHLIINNGWELYEISRQEKTLEDIFVKLTSHK